MPHSRRYCDFNHEVIMSNLRKVLIGILVFIGVLGIGYLLLRRPTQTVSVSDLWSELLGKTSLNLQSGPMKL